MDWGSAIVEGQENISSVMFSSSFFYFLIERIVVNVSLWSSKHLKWSQDVWQLLEYSLRKITQFLNQSII